MGWPEKRFCILRRLYSEKSPVFPHCPHVDAFFPLQIGHGVGVCEECRKDAFLLFILSLRVSMSVPFVCGGLLSCYSSASTRIRTWDHLLKRELLYQLSYGRIFLFSITNLKYFSSPKTTVLFSLKFCYNIYIPIKG